MKDLISMREFVMSRSVNSPFVQIFSECENYAKFISQPICLKMFTPCDKEEKVLEEQLFEGRNHVAIVEYHNAKERVLFEDVNIKDIGSSYMVILNGSNLFRYSKNRNQLENREPKIVEDLIRFGFTISESALKQIFI